MLNRSLQARFDSSVLPVAAVAFAVALGFGLVIPVLPLFARSFGVSATEVGLVVSVFALVRLIGDVPAGRLVDRVGIAPAMAAGTGIVGLSSLLVAFAPSFIWLVALRGVGGIGSALFSASLTAYVLERVAPDRMGRAMGTVSAAFLIGSVFGPAVGGVASGGLGLRAPFLLYGGFCGLAMLLSLLVVGRASRLPGAHASESPRSKLKLSPLLGAALVSTFALWWMVGGFRFALVPLYGREDLRLDEAGIGLGLTASALANLATLWPAGLAVDRLGWKVVGLPAFLLLPVGALTLLWAHDLIGYVVANAIYGAVYGVANVVPGVLLARAASSGRAGSAAGINSFAGDFGSVIGPLAIGYAITSGGYPAAVILAGVPALLAAAAVGIAPASVTPSAERHADAGVSGHSGRGRGGSSPT